MRVYLPATLATLAAALTEDSGRQLAGGPAYAVTPGLREGYTGGDTEELEYAALSLAAAASVSLIAADPLAPRRRVVVAAEIQEPSAVVTSQEANQQLPGQVTVVGAVPLSWVAAVHVDGPEAVDAVTAAALDPLDDFIAGDAADHELLWYATQELDDLVEELA